MANKEEEVIYVMGKLPTEPPEDEGLPPWMATFADMVTLLLCFFVLLLSFANQDIANFETLKGSMKDAFGVQFQDNSGKFMAFSKSPHTASSTSAAAKKEMQSLEVNIKAFITAGKIQKLMAVNTDQNGVLVRVPTRAIFKPGTAEINPRAAKLLDKVASVMKKKDFNLVVRGHTDDRATKNNIYSSNWELSAARAASCLRYILKRTGISSTRLKAVGYAGTKPLVPNTSNRNRAINRRVEFYYQPPSDKW